jgi:hypothetical protein
MADLTITAASVLLVSGTKEAGTAGATITAGQALYLDSATNTLKLAQADGTAAEADVIGIALHAALAGQPIVYAKNGASMNIGATTAKTTAYVLSALAGAICPQADLVSTNKIVYLAYATATDGSVVLNVRNTGAVV